MNESMVVKASPVARYPTRNPTGIRLERGNLESKLHRASAIGPDRNHCKRRERGRGKGSERRGVREEK